MQELRAQLYRFAFLSERRKFLGIAVRYWIQLGLMGLTVLWLWLQFWFQAALTSVLILFMNYLYSAAKRNNYKVFVDVPKNDGGQTEPLEPDVKLPVRGTGMFMSGEKEIRLILASGALWRTPKGDLGVMLEAAPKLYKYQFVEPRRVEKVRLGTLNLAGSTGPAVEVTFMSSWVETDMTDEIRASRKNAGEPTIYKKRTITLSFDDMAVAKQVEAFLSTAQ